MKDVIIALKDTPVPSILIVAGIVFILLALAGKFAAYIDLPPDRQKWAGIIGGAFLVIGLILYVVPKPSTSSNTTSTTTPPATANTASQLPTLQQATNGIAITQGPIQTQGSAALIPTLSPAPTPFESTPPPIQTPQSPTNTVTITSHQDGQKYPCMTRLSGTYTLDIKDQIWPIIYIGGVYYLQDEGFKGPPMTSDGNWHATISLGDCGSNEDVGKSFTLLVVVADEQANTMFLQQLEKARITGQPVVSFNSLPDGIQVVKQISLIRE